MVTDPPIGRDGVNLLYRIVQYGRQNFGRPYPLAADSDRRGAKRAIPGGYVVPEPDDRRLVRLTPKGTGFLEAMMRCE